VTNAVRNHACRLRTDLVWRGFQTVTLENERLRLTLLPGKGADLVEILHKPTDTDFAWWTSLGLRRATQDQSGFQENYAGGWQTCFPSLSAAHTHRGAHLPTYGETPLAHWDTDILEDTPESVAVRFHLELRAMPFRVEKILRLRQGEAHFDLEERVTNLSGATLEADWGQHVVFGEPFLRPGVRVTLPNRDTLVTPPRGAPGGFHTLDDLAHPEYRLERDDGIGARLEWRGEVWKQLWVWQDYGADEGAPYYGRHYNLGLELFSSPPAATLEDNVRRGTAVVFAPHATRTAGIRFSVIAP
jgi:hypothetical protein